MAGTAKRVGERTVVAAINAAQRGTSIRRAVDTVHLAQGKVRGWRVGQTVAYRSIPYAEAPIGARRFLPPGPAPSWDGIRDGHRFAPEGPQQGNAFWMPFGPRRSVIHEDCLYLNVSVLAEAKPGRPVLVWIHGGGFVDGSGSRQPFDPSLLVGAHDVIVVTINYRLGALGWLRLAHLPGGEQITGNVGLLDQIAALKWVHHNIAAFGGNPTNVTAVGASAGAMSIAAMLAIPRADELFQQAVLQSGAGHFALPVERAERVADLVLDKLQTRTIADLQQVPVSDLMAAQRAATFTVGVGDALAPSIEAFLPFGVVVDGDLLTTSPIEAMQSGAARPVPTIIGTTTDEWNFVGLHSRAQAPELLASMATRFFGGDHSSVIDTYRKTLSAATADDPDATVLHDTINTDHKFTVPAMRFADALREQSAPVYVYLFAFHAEGNELGAVHAAEQAYVFGNLAPWKSLQTFMANRGVGLRSVHRTMAQSWACFARTGTPGDFAGQSWERWDERKITAVIDRTNSISPHPFAERTRPWLGRM